MAGSVVLTSQYLFHTLEPWDLEPMRRGYAALTIRGGKKPIVGIYFMRLEHSRKVTFYLNGLCIAKDPLHIIRLEVRGPHTWGRSTEFRGEWWAITILSSPWKEGKVWPWYCSEQPLNLPLPGFVIMNSWKNENDLAEENFKIIFGVSIC